MPDVFTFTSVTRVTPSGGTIAGGTAVTITGFGFDFATGGVTFGGTALTNVSVVSNTQITGVTPAHNVGAVDVVVAGVGTGVGLFTYSNPDTLLLPRVPVSTKNPLELDTVGAVPWLFQVKKRIEQAPLVDSGSIVGPITVAQVPQLPFTKIDLTTAPRLLGRTTAGAGPAEEIQVAGGLTLSAGVLSMAGLPSGFVVGDLLYAQSSTALARLADVSVGSYLRSGGVATAPLWSTLKLPNTGVVGDLPFVSATNVVTMLADVAVGSYLRSGGLTTAPLWSTLKIPNAANSGDILRASSANTYASVAPEAFVRVNDTNVTATLTGSPTVALVNTLTMTLGWTGTLSVARGGIGVGTVSGVLQGNGTSAVTGSLLTASSGTLGTSSGAMTLTPTAGSNLNVSLATTGDFAVNTNQLYVDTSAAFVGINMVPLVALDIAGSTAQLTNTVAPEFRINLSTGTGSFATLGFYEGAVQKAVVQYIGSAFATVIRRGDLTLSSSGRLVSGVSRTILDGDATITSSRSLAIGKAANTFTGIELVANSTTWFIDHRGSVDATNNRLMFGTNATSNLLVVLQAGQVGIGTASPTAYLMLKAGTTAASTAPLKFVSGTLQTTAEAGAVEFVTDDYYATITTGAARKGIVLNDGTALTATRVPFATTNGRLTDDADLTFATDTLSATKVAMSSLTSGRVPFASTAGLLVDDSDMTFATDTLTVTKLSAPTSVSTGTLAQTGKTTTYNNVATAGWGEPAIYGSGRSTAQVAAVASVATYTMGAADGSVDVSANVNVTTSTTHNFAVQVAYTDETNTARTLVMTLSTEAGVLVTAITNVTGAGIYVGFASRLRVKASTAITVKTAGTFTTVTYNVEADIQQVA